MSENAVSLIKSGIDASQQSVERAGGSIETTVKTAANAGESGAIEKMLVASNSVQAASESGRGAKLNTSA
tara:strand:- start:188 stop:397 length:210 start_codon:yes stop_codon:yes gene_type:complete